MNVDKFVEAIEKAKRQSKEYGLDVIKMSFEFADCIVELLKEQQKEIEERTKEASAYAELLIKYGYEFV